MSTPAHTAPSVQHFLAEKQHNPCAHSPFSPDLAPSDFILFSWMKKVLKGKCFVDVEEVKQKMAEALKGIKIKNFKNCFEQWKKKSQ